ncbi:hypothetical protein PQQ32_04310 [Brachyspira hyodysenteriae]|uniref:hypothetical protein n=1 Tax=Brachyspira hyodysenteriae TaxID=159 RepID=UPI002B258F31|nr:hypothetical protein [Brachyspira hyodysenteriae]WPC38696.1 hypothetical protein PQQ32_04310 [Brachyspira hyodysenteriae]
MKKILLTLTLLLVLSFSAFSQGYNINNEAKLKNKIKINNNGLDILIQDLSLTNINLLTISTYYNQTFLFFILEESNTKIQIGIKDEAIKQDFIKLNNTKLYFSHNMSNHNFYTNIIYNNKEIQQIFNRKNEILINKDKRIIELNILKDLKNINFIMNNNIYSKYFK